MLNLRVRAAFALALALASGPTAAHAQTKPPDKPVYLTADPIEQVEDRPQGWSHAITLAANLNVASNRDVVGQVEGNSFLFGASVLAGASYARGRHELLNSGALTEAWSRTPTIDAFVKSNDLLDLQSLYNFFVNRYTGPFARVALQTSLFNTDRHTAQPVTYVREGVPTETRVTSQLRLSNSMKPLTISESLGWFVQPLRTEALNVSARAGFGGRHTFAEGARAISDESDAAMNVVYTVLQDVHQAGAELFGGFDGKTAEGRFLYTAGVSALFPFLNNDDTDRSILKLTKVTLAAAMGMGVVSWLSVNYQLKVVRDLQLVDAIQVQNSLLLSLQYTRSSTEPADKKAAEEKKQLEAEREARVAELEERVVAAEQRAAALEAKVGASPAPEPKPTPSPTLPEPAPSDGDQPARVPTPAP
jgi:hypothetical protein